MVTNKRLWAGAITVIALLAIAIISPLLQTPEEQLERKLSLTHQVSKSGDVMISWHPDAFNADDPAEVSVGYSFEEKGKWRRYKAKNWDASLGEAVFRNLSLEEEYRFTFAVKTQSGVSVTKRFSITIDAPVGKHVEEARVKKQLDFVDKRWNTRENSEYMYIKQNDCANFASQTLAARGFQQSWAWAQIDQLPTAAWVRATELNSYLRSLPGVKRLSDGQRDRVKLGDLVFFDWDRSGDSDHVGVVNLIQKQADGTIKIFYAGHTSHKHYRSVDWAIQVFHPNARVEFLSLPISK
jgi:hypothetical protein